MGMLKKIQYNCKQATLLLEKKVYQQLSFREVIELRIHLAGCSMCRLYGKQSAMINNMVQQLFKDSESGSYKLDEDFKKQLQLRIEEELNKE
jgi:predicted anti-sigma-YlaC factor YlaD